MGFYYALDMGTGKSKAAIDYFNGYDAKRVLILCPKKVTTVWPNQFNIHSANPFKVIAFFKDMPVKKKAVIIDDELKRCQIAGQRIAVILNYDAFWRSPLGPTYNEDNQIIQFGTLLRWQWDVLACDEAHRLMSPGGRAAWGAKRLANKATRRLMLSGTPMPSNPLNIYAQFRAMDSSIFGTSFVRFKSRYALMGGYQSKQVLKYINQEELSAKFFSRAIQCNKRDVLDLPDIMFEDRVFYLSKGAQRIYDELNKDLQSEVIHARLGGGNISADNALVKILRLCQLTGGLVKLTDGRELIKDKGKLEVAQEIVEDLPADEPIVIFYRWNDEATRLREMLEKKCKRSVGNIKGGVDDLLDFQAGKVNTLLVQIQAGGEGIDLTRSCYGIFFSIGYISPGVFDQATSRLDRPGQTRPVTFYRVAAAGTVDQLIYKSHEKKVDTINYVLNAIQDGEDGDNQSASPFTDKVA